jgi:hypothetical protein
MPARAPRVHEASHFNGRVPIDERVLRSHARASVASTDAVQRGPATVFRPTDTSFVTPTDALSVWCCCGLRSCWRCLWWTLTHDIHRWAMPASDAGVQTALKPGLPDRRALGVCRSWSQRLSPLFHAEMKICLLHLFAPIAYELDQVCVSL